MIIDKYHMRGYLSTIAMGSVCGHLTISFLAFLSVLGGEIIVIDKCQHFTSLPPFTISVKNEDPTPYVPPIRMNLPAYKPIF